MGENGRRRRCGAKEKSEVLEEARQAGALVSEVCRRYGISTGQYYQWDKQPRQGGFCFNVKVRASRK